MTIIKRMFGLLAGGERKDLQTGELFSSSELHAAGLNIYERPDPVPMAPPIGYKREPSMVERMRTMVLEAKVQRLAQELGAETPEEAEDFDVDDPDDFEPTSEWEYDRNDMMVLEAYEKLQNHRLAMDEKYGTTTADRNIDAAKKKAADELGAKSGVEGAEPPPEPHSGVPKAP